MCVDVDIDTGIVCFQHQLMVDRKIMLHNKDFFFAEITINLLSELLQVRCRDMLRKDVCVVAALKELLRHSPCASLSWATSSS